jgi:hypothetical protein
MKVEFQLTSYQVTFTVFFAIAWGAITNVQPRWKPFEAAIRDAKTKKRWWLSFRWFNAAPVLYYVAMINVLMLNVWSRAAALERNAWLQSVVLAACVVAAGAVFGFYRCWLGEVEKNADEYYFRANDCYYTHPDGQGECLGQLRPEYGSRNRCSGWSYIAVCAAALPVIGVLVWLVS